MGDVCLESERTIEARHEFRRHLERCLVHGTALAAYDVDVGGVRREVIAGHPVVDVGVGHETQVLEGFERAIDGRQRHRRPALTRDLLDDLLGRRVPQGLHRGEHVLALRREPPSGGPQSRAEITHPSNVCRSRGTPSPRTYTWRVLDDFQTEDSRANRRGNTQPRWGRRILLMIASVLVLALVAVGGFAIFLNQKVAGNITQENLLPTGAPTTADGKPVPTSGVGQNYLIVGSDARPGDTFSRSDVIVLVHVPEDKKSIQLIHFPRDLYVPIPGRKKDKINAAYAYGGAPLLVSTLQDLLGVKIDHVAKTDFDGFKKMTDAVGGVRVYAEESSTGNGTEGQIDIQKGWNNLNGAQALAFVRERKELSEGDISRGRRQQAFIKALMLKALSGEVLTNPVTLTKFIDAATENLIVDKDLSVGTMRGEAISMRNLRSSDVVFITAPFNGYGTAPDGGSIDILDEVGMKALGDALRADQMGDYADVSVIP